jgi:hypothetical protein
VPTGAPVGTASRVVGDPRFSGGFQGDARTYEFANFVAGHLSVVCIGGNVAHRRFSVLELCSQAGSRCHQARFGWSALLGLLVYAVGLLGFAQISVRGLVICSKLLAKPKTPGYQMVHTAFG